MDKSVIELINDLVRAESVFGSAPSLTNAGAYMTVLMESKREDVIYNEDFIEGLEDLRDFLISEARK